MSFTKEELAVGEMAVEHNRIQDKAGDADDSGIPSRFRGTDADKNDMMILGKKQVLRVCPSTTAIPPNRSKKSLQLTMCSVISSSLRC